MKRLGIVLLALIVARPLAAQRQYWPSTIDSLAVGRQMHTHAQVRGVVAFVGHEGDQDQHVRLVSLSGSGRFIIAECIPMLPCRLLNGTPWIPAVGDTVTVYGITRFDPEHKWWEIHPVEGVEP